MKKVFKYPLKYKNVNTFLGNGAEWEQQQILELPPFSKVLHVEKQGNDLVLWAQVNSEYTTTHKVGIEIVGTGHEINGNGDYLNTFHDGGLVMHVFVDYGMYNVW